MEDNIKIDLRVVIVRERVDWIQLAEDRIRWKVLVTTVPLNVGHFFTS
jgi:hypothetical protein